MSALVEPVALDSPWADHVISRTLAYMRMGTCTPRILDSTGAVVADLTFPARRLWTARVHVSQAAVDASGLHYECICPYQWGPRRSCLRITADVVDSAVPEAVKLGETG